MTLQGHFKFKVKYTVSPFNYKITCEGQALFLHPRTQYQGDFQHNFDHITLQFGVHDYIPRSNDSTLKAEGQMTIIFKVKIIYQGHTTVPFTATTGGSSLSAATP